MSARLPATPMAEGGHDGIATQSQLRRIVNKRGRTAFEVGLPASLALYGELGLTPAEVLGQRFLLSLHSGLWAAPNDAWPKPGEGTRGVDGNA